MNYGPPNPWLDDLPTGKPGLSLESYSFMIFDLRSPEMKLGDFVKDEIKKGSGLFTKRYGLFGGMYDSLIDQIAAL